MVGTQVELTAVVIEVILAAVLPGGEQLRLALRLVGVDQAHFGWCCR